MIPNAKLTSVCDNTTLQKIKIKKSLQALMENCTQTRAETQRCQAWWHQVVSETAKDNVAKSKYPFSFAFGDIFIHPVN